MDYSKTSKSNNFDKIKKVLLFCIIPLVFAYLGNLLENKLINNSLSEIKREIIKSTISSTNKWINNDMGNQSMFNERMKDEKNKGKNLMQQWRENHKTFIFFDKYYITSLIFSILSLSLIIIFSRYKVKLLNIFKKINRIYFYLLLFF